MNQQPMNSGYGVPAPPYRDPSMMGAGGGYPPYSQPPMQAVPQSPPIKGWAVPSEEAARQALIDLDGTPFLFLDANNGSIYLKRINPTDFTVVFQVYRPDPVPPQANGADLSGYVPRADFDALVQMVQELRQAQSPALPAPKKGKENPNP